MAASGKIGEPIPTCIIGSEGTPLMDEVFESERRPADSVQQLEMIKDELKQLSHTIAQLAESATKYAQARMETAAQTAVDRYPVGSIVLAALIGFWFAGRRRR